MSNNTNISELSFANDLWVFLASCFFAWLTIYLSIWKDGFPVICKWLQNGLGMCKNVHSYFKRRSMIEEEYAKSLAKLLVKIKQDEQEFINNGYTIFLFHFTVLIVHNVIGICSVFGISRLLHTSHYNVIS